MASVQVSIFWHPYYTNQFGHSFLHSFAAQKNETITMKSSCH